MVLSQLPRRKFDRGYIVNGGFDLGSADAAIPHRGRCFLPIRIRRRGLGWKVRASPLSGFGLMKIPESTKGHFMKTASQEPTLSSALSDARRSPACQLRRS